MQERRAVHPIRISLCTYNLWNTERWPERRPSLEAFLARIRPDVLCVQELRRETMECLDACLPGHRRVEEPFPGWTTEGNIYWNSAFLEASAYGAADVGIEEEHRRLFWVRLRVRPSGPVFFVGTAHLTYRGHPREKIDAVAIRVIQTRRIIQALQSLVEPGEPAFFMGDLNDPYHPPRLLHEAGYRSCFGALGVVVPPTSPALPTSSRGLDLSPPTETIDWLVSNDQGCRAVAASVPQTYVGDLAPSDHWPVLAVYEIS